MLLLGFDTRSCGTYCFRFQLGNSFHIHEVGSVTFFNFRIAAFTESQRKHRLAALAVLLFHTPLLVAAKRGLQIGFLCMGAHLIHDKRELSQINGTDTFQIGHLAIAPFFVFLFWQYANIHQHVHGSRIPTILTLVVHGRMDGADQFPIIHLWAPLTMFSSGISINDSGSDVKRKWHLGKAEIPA